MQVIQSIIIGLLKLIKNNLQVLIPALVTIIGFFINFIIMKRQFKKAREERIIEKRTDAYFKCYDCIDKIIDNKELLYNENYYSEVLSFKAKIKLLSSKNVIGCYKKLLNEIFDLQKEFIEFKNEHDPSCNQKNYYEITPDDCDSVSHEACGITENDLQMYEDKVKKFKIAKQETIEIIINEIKDLCDAMRIDIGNCDSQ